MNRTGLIVALVLSLLFVVVFSVWPELDLRLSAAFYDKATGTFPVKSGAIASFARDAAMWIAWAFAAPSIIALLVKLARPLRPLLVPGRTVVFLIVTITLAAGIISNAGFKTHWGRPRPVSVTEFGGPWVFKPWYDPSGACPKNCSFFSGEGATAFWTYAPAALAPPQWRPLAYAGATLFGLATGGLRIAFGGHFLTDVLASGLVTFLVIWLCYAMIYRWPATRLTDEGVDAALTRFALPSWRRVQRWLGRSTVP